MNVLINDIGERHVYKPEKLTEASEFIGKELKTSGANVYFEEYTESITNHTCTNVIGEYPGHTWPEKILVVGAHYDTVRGTNGADDNGSGVAALLYVAKVIQQYGSAVTVRLVAFSNEEEPFFDTPDMGSNVHAKACADRGDDIIGAIVFECLGYFNSAPGSQSLPFPINLILPSTGHFMLSVSNFKSRRFQKRFAQAYKGNSEIPLSKVVLPMKFRPARLSDHISFYRFGYDAVMVTNTGPFRNPHYHKQSDTLDKLDFENYGKNIIGLCHSIISLSNTTFDG